jgi:hypothetical protein
VSSSEILNQHLLERLNKTITTSVRIISLWAENRYRLIGLLCLVPAVKKGTYRKRKGTMFGDSIVELAECI